MFLFIFGFIYYYHRFFIWFLDLICSLIILDMLYLFKILPAAHHLVLCFRLFTSALIIVTSDFTVLLSFLFSSLGLQEWFLILLMHLPFTDWIILWTELGCNFPAS